MLFFNFCFHLMWKELFRELRWFGKILFAPLLSAGTICFLPLIIIELLFIDWIAFLFVLCSKNISVKEFAKCFIMDK